MSDMHLSLLCPAHYWATCAFKRDANQSAGAKWMTRNAYACFFWRLTQRSIDCLLIPEEMFSLWAVMEPNAIWVRWHLRSLLRPVCVSPPQNMCTKCGVQSLSRSSPIWLCKICSENKEVRCTEAYECCFRAMEFSQIVIILLFFPHKGKLFELICFKQWGHCDHEFQAPKSTMKASLM